MKKFLFLSAFLSLALYACGSSGVSSESVSSYLDGVLTNGTVLPTTADIKAIDITNTSSNQTLDNIAICTSNNQTYIFSGYFYNCTNINDTSKICYNFHIDIPNVNDANCTVFFINKKIEKNVCNLTDIENANITFVIPAKIEIKEQARVKMKVKNQGENITLEIENLEHAQIHLDYDLMNMTHSCLNDTTFEKLKEHLCSCNETNETNETM